VDLINRIADKLQQLTVKSQGMYFFGHTCVQLHSVCAVNEKRRLAQEHTLNLSEFKGNCKWILATWQHVNSLQMRRWTMTYSFTVWFSEFCKYQ